MTRSKLKEVVEKGVVRFCLFVSFFKIILVDQLRLKAIIIYNIRGREEVYHVLAITQLHITI